MALNKKILVIGDLILDEYIVGEGYRISDEAPVPIVKIDDFVPRLGGAANVANNIVNMGQDALLCGAIGNSRYDKSASRFMGEMKQQGLSTSYIVEGDMKTTVKSRVIIKKQQVVRFDFEDTVLPMDVKEEILEKIYCLDFRKIGLIVVSDYHKGVVIEDVMSLLNMSCVRVVVDPKPGNEHCYHGIFCMTPNLKEFNKFTNNDFHKDKLEGIETVADNMRRDFGLESLIVTLGEKGALCCIEGDCRVVRGHGVEVSNTIGAGDTFVSALCCALVGDDNIFDATRFANTAAGIVVAKNYTGVCSLEEVNDFLKGETNG